MTLLEKVWSLRDPDAVWHLLRERTIRKITVPFGPQPLHYRVSSWRELNRARSALSKEPGTVKWISQEVAPGEVFYDIGANMGIYSIMAGAKVGATGAVYAFEPHGGTFGRLLANITANRMERVIHPCSMALHHSPGFLDFNYKSMVSGSSNSQLGTTIHAGGDEFAPLISELKAATTIDDLLDAKAIRPAQHVKIDVDGNEPHILLGMKRFLRSDFRPRRLQVEINIPVREQVFSIVQDAGYTEIDRHYTEGGQRRIDRGGDPEGYAYNVVFAPA